MKLYGLRLSSLRWAWRDRRQWVTRFEKAPTTHTLILVYNSLYGDALDVSLDELPPGCEITNDRRWLDEAAAVVFHIPSLLFLPRRKRPGQLWVAWSLECEENYPQLKDPAFMRPFDLSMTYRLSSDIVSLYSAYFAGPANLIRALTVPPSKVPDKLVAMFVSSRINRSHRLEYARELMRHVEIHSYGAALRNRRLVPDHGRPSKIQTIANYKFTIAFENAIGEDYVTEKFYDPLVAGSVPIYLGAPNVETFAPADHCFINITDFPNPKDLAEYLLYLNHDDAAYAEYLAWKTRPLRPGFLKLMETQTRSAWTRLCQRVQTSKSRGSSL